MTTTKIITADEGTRRFLSAHFDYPSRIVFECRTGEDGSDVTVRRTITLYKL